MFKARSKSCNLVLFIVAAISIIHLEEAGKTICPYNEFYTSCGEACQTTCATLNEPCPIRLIRCPDGCYCNDGYARDANGICIPIKDCPNYYY